MKRRFLSIWCICIVLLATIFCFFPRTKMESQPKEDADIVIDVGLIENFSKVEWHWRIYDAETGELLDEWWGCAGVP